jgi:hypothetical protein
MKNREIKFIELKIEEKRPSIESIITEKNPTAFGGRDFPLREISHRDFEHLTYSLYKQEIKEKKFDFSDISLMSGIRDNAQDCVLYKNNVKAGIIQCKHSEKDTKPSLKLCVEEIIKFILYSIQDKSLIPDINKFTYYFASSSGFDTVVDDYLKTFKTKIAKEKNLKSWTNNVIKNFTSIKLSFEDIKSELIQKLSMLNVRLIVPSDIQGLLKNHENSVAKSFFSLRLVTDNTAIKKLTKKVNKLLVSKKQLGIDNSKILKELKEASIFLANYKSAFSLNSPIKIEREITGKILEWIKTPLPEKKEGIAIVKGEAGCGKSVILNNLYLKLENEEIPVLALKADEKNAETIEHLGKKIGFSNSILVSVEAIANNYPKVVIIIDQIDALSHTLSSNRDNLNTYILLLEKLKAIPNVRIVISVREYDLAYDPALSIFKKNESFNINKLEELEVLKILKRLKVTNVNPSLLKLLSVPLHLELFCQVYNKKEIEIKINSLYDLYNKFWQLKIEKKGDFDFRENLKKTIFLISSKIYEHRGSLAVSANFFDSSTINFLKTEGVLLENNNNEVMFFHQTFYDYVFARQFVEQNNNVLEYLNDNNQGLFIRSCLKIILAHLREQNAKAYNELLVKLISSNKIRYHIKQLVFDYLGFIENPSVKEKEFVESYIIDSKNEILFYESIKTKNWLEYFIEMGWIDKYLFSDDTEKYQVCRLLIFRSIEHSGHAILEYLDNLEQTENIDEIIYTSLYFLKNWNKKATLLFERLNKIVKPTQHHFCECLENAIQFDEGWALNQIKELLLERVGHLTKYSCHFSVDYSEIKLIKKMFIQNKVETFQSCINIIEKAITQTMEEIKENCLIEDGAFRYFF